jgi:hypothetical protein
VPGKRRVRRQTPLRGTRKGSKWLRSALAESAYAAARTKNTYLAAQFWRLAGRRGKRRAAVPVGHSILVVAYHLLDTGKHYKDLGGDYFATRLSEQASHPPAGLSTRAPRPEGHPATRRTPRRLIAVRPGRSFTIQSMRQGGSHALPTWGKLTTAL